jgi:hypothetical protein
METTCIPRCYYAARDQQSGGFSIVLEDLSQTHFQTEYPLPPTIDLCEMALDCLAEVHAAWWNRDVPEAAAGELAGGRSCQLGGRHSKGMVSFLSIHRGQAFRV